VAGRVGQIINVSGLASDCGISPITVKSWLSILESSYIIYLLQPHHKNFNKRLIKNPKLYFFDTGIFCYLLGINTKDQVGSHYALGSIFENFIITEYYKYRYNRVKKANCYFWLDKHKKEIDLIIENNILTPIEIKAGKTYNDSFLNQLNYWNSLSGNSPDNTFLVYGGNNNYSSSKAEIIGRKGIHNLFGKLDS